MERQLVKLSLVVLLTVWWAQGIKIHPDGGYDVVIALDHKDESVPANVDTYIDNILSTLRTLSVQMWIATEQKFWIKSVELVIPPSWSPSSGNVGISTKSFSTADIRISSDIKVPNVENPNLCGLPGNHIELPLSFFVNANAGEYGPNWKALLVLWTRYRWGAYDEHGYPGDEKFPYFYPVDRPAEGEDKWLTTGCTNNDQNRLVGAYHTLNGTACDPTSESLDASCRFWPDQTGNPDVTSSLMHFHWLESITHFCDEHTHKKDALNRQNLYCDYKSILEVIRSSPDAKAVTSNSSDHVPTFTSKITKPTENPVLYLLLENGEFPPEEIHTVISQRVELGRFFASEFPSSVLAAVASYPASESSAGLKSEVPFELFNVDHFVEAIGNYHLVQNPARDFARAIEEAAGAIGRLNPINGGAILIVKTSNATRNSEFYYEKDLELQLRRQNISLFAIELSTGNSSRHLTRLANLTKGASVDMRDNASVQSLLRNVTSFVSGMSSPNLEEHSRLVWRSDYTLGTRISIPVVEGNQLLTFMLVTPVKRNITEIFGGISSEAIDYGADFTESYEYSDDEDPNTRFIYTGTLNTTRMRVKQVEFSAQGEGTGRLFVFSEGQNLPRGIMVEVTTSDDNVDLTSPSNPNAPFVIYAKVTHDGKPVAGANVTALIRREGTSESDSVMLHDNGDGNGDVTAGDGVFSGVYLPPKNGAYLISVTVQKVNGRYSILPARLANGFGLIPVNQDFGEADEAVTIPGGVVEVATFNGIVQFTNREAYKPVVQRSLDLSIKGVDSDLTFTLKAPVILGNNAAPKVYILLRSTSKNDLISLDLEKELPANVKQVLNYTNEAVVPGQAFGIPFEDKREDIYYYALVAWEGDVHSPVSNIVRVGSLSDGTTTSPPNDSTTEDTSGATDDTTTSSAGPTDEVTGSTSTVTTTSSDGTTASTGKTEPAPMPEENKPWIKSGGGIATVIVIVILIFVVAGGSYWYVRRRRQMKVTQSSSTLREST